MTIQDLLDKVERALETIKVAGIAGTSPRFVVQQVKTKGDPVIGLTDNITGDLFVVQVQKLKRK